MCQTAGKEEFRQARTEESKEVGPEVTCHETPNIYPRCAACGREPGADAAGPDRSFPPPSEGLFRPADHTLTYGRYGVLAPDLEHYDWYREQNKLIDLWTERTLAVIHAHSGALRANHVQIEPGNWSRDGSLFLWRVAGKWSPTALVLLKIRGDKLLWQVNILEAAQRAILTRTKRASPRRYRAAVRENRGSGAAFPDGFAVPVDVNVEPGKPLSLPLKVTASLTSNPKEIEDYPKNAELNSELDAILTKAGRFEVTKFALTPPR